MIDVDAVTYAMSNAFTSSWGRNFAPAQALGIVYRDLVRQVLEPVVAEMRTIPVPKARLTDQLARHDTSRGVWNAILREAIYQWPLADSKLTIVRNSVVLPNGVGSRPGMFLRLDGAAGQLTLPLRQQGYWMGEVGAERLQTPDVIDHWRDRAEIVAARRLDENLIALIREIADLTSSRSEELVETVTAERFRSRVAGTRHTPRPRQYREPDEFHRLPGTPPVIDRDAVIASAPDGEGARARFAESDVALSEAFATVVSQIRLNGASTVQAVGHLDGIATFAELTGNAELARRVRETRERNSVPWISSADAHLQGMDVLGQSVPAEMGWRNELRLARKAAEDLTKSGQGMLAARLFHAATEEAEKRLGRLDGDVLETYAEVAALYERAGDAVSSADILLRVADRWLDACAATLVRPSSNRPRVPETEIEFRGDAAEAIYEASLERPELVGRADAETAAFLEFVQLYPTYVYGGATLLRASLLRANSLLDQGRTNDAALLVEVVSRARGWVDPTLPLAAGGRTYYQGLLDLTERFAGRGHVEAAVECATAIANTGWGGRDHPCHVDVHPYLVRAVTVLQQAGMSREVQHLLPVIAASKTLSELRLVAGRATHDPRVPEQASQVRRHFAQRRRSDAVANIEDAVSAFACEQLENGILVGEPTDLLPPGPERLRALGIPSGMDTRASVLAYVGLAARRTPSVHTERAARICTELVAITHDLDAGTATPHDAISRVAGIQRDVSGPRPRGNAVDEVAEGIVFDFDMRVRNAEPSVVHATISAFLDDVAATIVNRAPDLQEPLSFAGSVEHTL